METNTVKLHRVIKSTPEKIYKAFLDPAAMCKWLPPHGFTGTVHEMDPTVGGRYKMSFGGEYLELVPNEKIVNTDSFDDPNMPGEMKTTVELRPVTAGTEVNITQEGIPAMIPVEMCYLGWQESLQLLALLVEPNIPDGPEA